MNNNKPFKQNKFEFKYDKQRVMSKENKLSTTLKCFTLATVVLSVNSKNSSSREIFAVSVN